MIRKTPVIRILEDIHKRTDMRYGQIINNALQVKLGRKDCDCGKGDMKCECKNHNGAAYDIFYTWDEDLAEMLEEFRFRVFPELKRIRSHDRRGPSATSRRKS
jgi:hypothetical protein